MRPPETEYIGIRCVKPPNRTPNGVYVGVKGRSITPAPECRLNPVIGFEWGYCGAGPLQLALALVYDATGDRDIAWQSHEWFMRAAVANWGQRWSITAGEICTVIERWRREQPRPRSMPDPAYIPTLDEALADPDGFVEGMSVEEFHCVIDPKPEGGDQ